MVEDCDHTRYLRDEENEVYGIEITSAILEDIGKYTYTASNDACDAKGECDLHVHSE